MIALLAAGALICWPASVQHIRPPVPAGPRAGGRLTGAQVDGARLIIGGSAATAVLVTVISGPLVGLSAVLVFATVAILIRSELARRREQHDLSEMLAATRTLAREIRAGAAPVAAIIASGSAHHGRSAEVLEALAVEVAGDRGRPAGPGIDDDGRALAAEITQRLVRGWSLSSRYGVPWAALVETVSLDLADRVHAKAQRSAQVSGPRVSGYVLAAMPALGVLLGVGMGADPLHVLFGTGAGRLMLLVGCLLTCAGLAWTARIVRG